MSEEPRSLQEAKNLVRACPAPDTRNQRIELRKSQLAKEKLELASILPVEGREAKEVMKQRVELLERTVQDPTFEERYPYLSMEVLRWRNKQGLPKLACFSLADPVFSIGASWIYVRATEWRFEGSIQQLPRAVAKMYDDVANQFWDEYQKDLMKEPNLGTGKWQKSIASRFNGIIPQWVREKIHQAAPDFSVSIPRVEIERVGFFRKREVVKTDIVTHIFLIAEVDAWVERKEVIPHPDPLVVGYKAGCLWLICSFDETPHEEYVRREFSA